MSEPTTSPVTPVAEPKPERPNTDPYAPGNKTSEYRVAMAIAVAAGLLGGIESAVALAKEAYPGSWWVPLVAALVTMLGAAMSYLKGRSNIKTAILVSEAHVASNNTTLPISTSSTHP